VGVVGSHEHNCRRNVFGLQPLERSKAVELRHGNIEKYDFRTLCEDLVARFVSVTRFSDYFNTRYVR
jgi:hypothetical protein